MNICKLNCMLSCFMHFGVLHRACGALSCLTIYVDCVTCNSIVSHSSAAVRASSELRDPKTLCWWFQQPQGDNVIPCNQASCSLVLPCIAAQSNVITYSSCKLEFWRALLQGRVWHHPSRIT